MDPAKTREVGKGRGNIIMKLLQEKEKKEKIEKQRAENEAGKKFQLSKLPMQLQTESIEVPKTSGLGRANLLNTMKAMRPVETSTAEMISSAVIAGQGRGSLINRLKAMSSVKTPIQETISISPTDTEGVLGNLSDITIHERQSVSAGSTSIQTLKRASYRGTSGKVIPLSANYINVKLDPGKGLFSYEVKFNPDIDSRSLRSQLLNQHLETIGRTRVFDGTILYLPQQIEQDRTVFESIHPTNGSKVKLTLIFKKVQSMSENISFFNVLLGRVMRALDLVRIGQHSFNPKGIQTIPEHKLEVWPGYVTTINEYDGGLKLCIDARHRVMRTETVRDTMIRFEGRSNFKDAIVRELVGLSVFTKYNNKTYRVDDIDWDKNPTHVFDKGAEKVSLLDYYKFHWNLEIKDRKQPLLVHCSKIRLSTGQTQEQMILLVPELCYIASLTDSIRSDHRVMRDLDTVTKMSPDARHKVFQNFIHKVNDNEIPREILAAWGLRLEPDIMEFTGRVLESETIIFRDNRKFTPSANRPAEWSSAVCRNHVLRAPRLDHWCIVYSYKDARCTEDFVTMLMKVSQVMGMTVTQPQKISLRDDRIESYVHALRNNIRENVNLMVVVFPTNRSDKYSVVKRVCCVENPVPSQVIIARTISRADKLKSITEKIALQINCKLGGALWALEIPMENCMICGIDVFHAGVGQVAKGSVAGFVASLDKMLTSWHSKICVQGKHQELVDILQICLLSAIKAYHKHNKCYPDRIIVYRDGVGDGQLDTVTNYEVKQMLATLKTIELNYQPSLTVIIVQKRINTRLFAKSRGLANPPPGTIVDNQITKPRLYDFFLVSQNIRQGTVSPTRYIVVFDNRNMKPEHVQRLSYKLCHLYYNWPGTIKIPAPCQYAHKLVSLVGQNLQLEPHHSLSNVLYYL